METVRASIAPALAARYDIDRELGAGAMAEVFLAHDLKHDRMVAIKVLKPELASAIGADRFQREIEVVAGLTHPHVLPLHDSGEVAGLLYYVMPYIEGGSLRGRLEREGRLPVPDAIRITREMADALGFAHRRGVIHRDVKPGNILLTEDHALLADFGIAHLAETEGATLTGAGLALGTPTYFSPEQATGERDVDGRSDIYSLGCVLYEALTGQPPFTATSVRALITHHLVDPPAQVRELRPEVSEGIEAVVQTALQKQPEERFQTAEEMAGSLDLVAGGFEAVVAAALRKLVRRSRWLHGKRVAILAVVAVAALIVGIIAIRSAARAPVVHGPQATYMLVPFRGGGATEREVEIAERAVRTLYFHLSYWTSIRVVELDALEGPIADLQLAGVGLPSLNLAAVQELAERVEASHVVQLEALMLGDSMAVVATIRPRGDPGEQERAIRRDGRSDELELITAGLALEILGLHGEAADYDDLINRSPNHAAHQQFREGQIALYDWRLAEAEEHFRAAIEADSAFALAHHYLAQTLYWRSARDRQRIVDLGPEIEYHSRRAEQYGVGERLRPGEHSHVGAFRAFWTGDYDRARVRYDSILSFNPTDLEGLVLRGAVEFDDPWLTEGRRGSLTPRQDLGLARAMFDSAASLASEWQLALGRLFDLDYRLARAAYEGYCYGFSPPGGELRPPYVVAEAAQQRAYCPLPEHETVRWLPDSLSAADRERAARSARLLHQKTVERLQFWARVEKDHARPHEELVDWMLWERSVPGCSADELWADSLLREAQDHLSAALSLRGDTTPEDRARLGALVLARGELESALEHADRALQDLGDWQGGGPLPPIEAANVYLAAGRSHPTVEILERSWGEDTYAVPDPESGDYIQAGSVLGTLGALRALGLTGGEGWEIEQRFAALERAWSVPEYSRRELALLRLYFLREVSPALARIPERWAGWFEGWDEHGLEIPAIWRGLLVAEAHPEEARRHLQEGIRELEGRRSQRLRAVHFLMPIVLARRIEADSIAADLSVRAGACPLAVNGIDFGWGMEESLAGSLEELAEP